MKVWGRIRRFGGEGTGGRCMVGFDWRPGQTSRFLVTATAPGNQTAYAGSLWSPDQHTWTHLVTFRTHTGGGLTWPVPREIWRSSKVHLCELAVGRSPDGRLFISYRDTAPGSSAQATGWHGGLV